MITANTVWMVEDDEAFRDLARTIAEEAGVRLVAVGPDDLAPDFADRPPHGAILDGSALSRMGELLLERVPRVVVCTARGADEIPGSWAERENTRLLLKPFDVASFEGALRWVSGEADDTDWENYAP